MSELKQVFETPDGKVFDSKAEALDHLRRPKILDAMHRITDGNVQLSEWLVDNQDTVTSAFGMGTIRRVSKSERNRLIKALDAIEAAGDPKFAFVVDNKDAVLESFRWPKVKRMTDGEKAVAVKNTIKAASDGNADLADWVIKNEERVLEAYDAGKEKRSVSPKAQASLAAYRAGKAAEKEALESGKSKEEAAKIGKKVADDHKAAALGG